MLSRVRGFLGRGAGRLPGALVLLALGSAAAAGYVNDWKLPRIFGNGAFSGEKESPAPEETSEAAATGAAPAESRPIRLSAEAVRKSGVETTTAVERPMARYAHAHGNLDYDQTRYAHVVPRAPGVVWQVYRQSGEAVRQGDLLAVVESAEVGRAKAAFLLSLVQVEARESALKAVQAQAKVVPGAFPEASVREAEFQVRETRAHLFADQQALFNLGLPIALEEVAGLPEGQIMRRLRLLGLPDAVVHPPDSLAVPLDPNTATANLLPVTAPFDGVVVSRSAAVGEEASPTRPLFIVADLRKVWVACEVRLEDVGLLKVGQELVVRADGAAEDAPKGWLTWVSAEADEKTHTVQARAEVPNPEGNLRPNTPFEGNIVVARKPRAVAVPTEAVQWREQIGDGTAGETGRLKTHTAVVFVRISDEEYQPRQVVVGLRDETYTELLSGVAPGEVVVTRGSHVLKAEWLKDRIGGDD